MEAFMSSASIAKKRSMYRSFALCRNVSMHAIMPPRVLGMVFRRRVMKVTRRYVISKTLTPHVYTQDKE
jgi:hypothetical protein